MKVHEHFLPLQGYFYDNTKLYLFVPQKKSLYQLLHQIDTKKVLSPLDKT